MPTSVEEPAMQAIGLSPADRARLSDLSLASPPEGADPEVDAAWEQEIQRRVIAVECGTAQLRDAAVYSQCRPVPVVGRGQLFGISSNRSSA